MIKIDDFGHQSDAKLAPAPALSANPAPVTDFDDATVRSPEKNTLEKNNPEKTNPEKIMRLLHLDCEEFFRRGFSQGPQHAFIAASEIGTGKSPYSSH